MSTLGITSKVAKRLSDVKYSRVGRRWTTGGKARHKRSCKRLNRSLRRAVTLELADLTK